MVPVLLLSLRQLGSRWRLLLIVLLAAMPVGMTALVSATAGNDARSNSGSVNGLDGLLISGILPIVMMVLATASFGNELEDRTLSYLVLKPVSRWRIALPKLLASIVIGGPLLVISGVANTLLASHGIGARLIIVDGDLQAAFAVGAALLVGVVAYATIFTWAGLISTRALALALFYVFLWEGVITTFLSGVRYLSVRGYTLAILHGLDDTTFSSLENRVIEFPAALVGAAVVTAVFFWLTVLRLRRMDVP